MKMTRTRTLRGQLEVTAGGTAKAQLIVDDGLLNRGYRVTGFFVWENSGSPTQFNAVLSMSPVTVGTDMDASKNNQIAWAWQATSGGWKEYILDPNHVIVRDLFVTVSDASNDFYNYMIVVEEYAITDDEAIMNIIKEGSQSL
jgi:hypothetical protein|tara:strand:- start:774 stop:1202 length:429 start_codon:yes stop_codon:yes gene_type:complete